MAEKRLSYNKVAPCHQGNDSDAYSSNPQYPNYQPYPSAPPEQYPPAIQQPPMSVIQPPSPIPHVVVVGSRQFHCRKCGYEGVPGYYKKPSTTAWVSCCLLFMVCWPLMLVPFCIDDCYERHPTCPNHA